jgi:hypothetical protein
MFKTSHKLVLTGRTMTDVAGLTKLSENQEANNKVSAVLKEAGGAASHEPLTVTTVGALTSAIYNITNVVISQTSR